MADNSKDDFVDIDDLIELARATRLLVLRLDGIKGENGILSRIESAEESLEKIDVKIACAVEKFVDIALIGDRIDRLPEELISKVDTLRFRSAVSQVLEAETGKFLDKIQDVSLGSVAVSR